MTEFASVRFHSMAAELAARIEKTIAEFGEEHGAQAFDIAAMAQSHCDVSDLAREAMMFGLNFWAGEQLEEVDRSNNVLPFASAFERRSPGRPSPEASPEPAPRISDSR